MNGRAFLDTNVLIYAVLDHGPKVEIAQLLVASGAIISVQVLNEFAAVARRKFGKSWAEIDQALQAIRSLVREIAPITVETHDSALGISARLDYGVYDAMIIASAASAGCDLLYSEDMQDGQMIDGVRIVNPFAG